MAERLLWLGSGELERVGVPPKAGLLDRAKSRGVSVPDGFVITGGVDPAIAGRAAARMMCRRFAVRSAFGAEDGTDESMAGWFDTELDVAATGVADAVVRVRRSAQRRPGAFRTDVLVMAMVDAARSGVAFSEPGTYDDIVNEIGGTADALVAGAQAGRRHLLPRIERVPSGWRRRLQTLLGQVRLEFGDHGWDVEWSDDGDRCWMVQIRPVTAPPVRSEHLTLANHAEILPTLPSPFMTSLIAEAGPDLFEWYRQFDRTLPSNRSFLQVRAGRPLINLSLLEDMMRHLGLPTGLVADSIGGDAVERRPLHLRRLAAKLPVLTRLAIAQARATASSRRIRSDIVARAGGDDDFGTAIRTLHRVYVDLVTGMFPLSSAIGPPLAILRRLGTLTEHSARHRTVTTEMADALTELADRPDGSTLDRFLAEFGHRGVYESDIARPRYREQRDELAQRSHGTGGTSTRIPRTLRGMLTAPIWAVARRPVEARELLRHDAMRAFDAVRADLLRLAGRAVADGQLPSVDHIWSLDVDEARRLDVGWVPDDDFWRRRLARTEHFAGIEVPPVVDSSVEPEMWRHDANASGDLTGLSLTGGAVTGRAWVLDEPAMTPPPADGDDAIVLVARSIDAGWISTLTHCDAAVIEIGGDLSHGSILVRERGLPAVTNVAGATRRIRDGQRLVVNAGAGVVEVLDTDPLPIAT